MFLKFSFGCDRDAASIDTDLGILNRISGLGRGGPLKYWSWSNLVRKSQEKFRKFQEQELVTTLVLPFVAKPNDTRGRHTATLWGLDLLWLNFTYPDLISSTDCGRSPSLIAHTSLSLQKDNRHQPWCYPGRTVWKCEAKRIWHNRHVFMTFIVTM